MASTITAAISIALVTRIVRIQWIICVFVVSAERYSELDLSILQE